LRHEGGRDLEIAPTEARTELRYNSPVELPDLIFLSAAFS
jgi:hypothetical protein